MLPLHVRKDSEIRGRHLVAAAFISKGQLIFVERPLVSLQSLDNLHAALVCRYCRGFVGSPDQRIGLASGRTSRQDVFENVIHSCPCGEVYCSQECLEDHSACHALLCTKDIEDEKHPLVQFKIHAIQHNEIFLMVADAVVGMVLDRVFYETMLDFSRAPWWKVATEPLLENPAGLAEAAHLDSTLRRLCQESSDLLKQALLLQNLPLQNVDELVSPTQFGRFIGSFEQNAIGIRQRNPLCREIFNKDLRETNHPDLLRCLERAGMIGQNDQGSEEETATTATCCEDNHENDNVAPSHELVYTSNDIATFMSSLYMDEQAEHNDLDELFPPLDGTAMYATACKMNHSCDPNVVVLYQNTTQPLVAHCMALHDINEGEELCISYIASNESLSERREALATYGFECCCTKCKWQEAELDSKEASLSQYQQEAFDNDLFGPDDNDDDDGDDDAGEKGSDDHENDGEAALQKRLKELDQALNKSAVNTIPITVRAVACNYVIRVGAAALLPNDLQEDMKECVEAIRSRNFVACCKIGSLLEEQLYGTLQRNGSWPDTAHRDAYGCVALTCSLGNLHVGSLLKAQVMLDKAFILDLPRNEIQDFFHLVEYVACQCQRGPCRPAIECTIDNALDLSLAPLEFPILEASPDIALETFESKYISQRQAVVLRHFATSWTAAAKWRDMNALVWNHGHRLVPTELGTMMGRGGMKEQIMSLRSFITTYLAPSSQKSHWTLDDATNSMLPVAYLAQHPLLDQIPELCRNIEMHPRLLTSPPLHRNIWMGTGGTRTPLHFDSYDNLLVQIVGYKYVRVYGTGETEKLYVIRGASKCDVSAQGNMSAVNCELEDLEAHPLARDAKYHEIHLGPGDCLFLPAQMWHYVRSLSTSISVNYWW